MKNIYVIAEKSMIMEDPFTDSAGNKHQESHPRYAPTIYAFTEKETALKARDELNDNYSAAPTFVVLEMIVNSNELEHARPIFGITEVS